MPEFRFFKLEIQNLCYSFEIQMENYHKLHSKNFDIQNLCIKSRRAVQPKLPKTAEEYVEGLKKCKTSIG